MFKHHRWLSVGFISLVALSAQSLPAAADDDLVDRQDTAVATNLELFGGLLLDIKVDPNDDGQYVYVTTYTPNGVFSSQDSGTTWTGLSADVDYGAGKAVVVDPASGDVYAAIGDDLLVSTNHGTSWTSLTDNLAGELPLVGSELGWSNGTLVVAVDNGAVQVSSDKGNTFTSVTLETGTRQNAISIQGDAAGKWYAVLMDYDTDTSQVFSSLDDGVTWAMLDVEAGGVTAGSVFYSIAVDPINIEHLVLSSYHPDYDSYQSFDGGDTWTALLNGTSRIGGEEAVFDGVGGLYLGIYYTNDASVAAPVWSQITTDTPLSSVQGDQYAVDAVHPTTVYSNTAFGVAKSEDQGATWVDSVTGISAVQTFAIAQANDKDRMWLGANGGLAKTSNFTAEHPDWEYPISPEENGGSIYAVWVKPSDGDYVVTGASNFLYYTADGGDTWTQAEAPEFFGTVQAIVPSPRDNSILYALYTNNSLTEDDYNGGVMKSTDAGKNWSELDFPSTLADGALAVAEQDDRDVVYVGIGAGGSENGIYTYADGEWTLLDADFNEFYVNNLLVHPQDNTIIFASFETESTAGSLYRSADGGDNWEEITTGLDDTNHLGVMVAQTDSTTTLYLSGQDGHGGEGMLYKSTDSGDSWSAYYQGKKQEFFYALLFDGLVAGNDRGLYGLQSLGDFSLKKKAVASGTRLTATLRDAATRDRLVNKRVTLYRKVNGSWRELRTVKTDSQGRARVTISATSGRVKVVWKPKAADRAEYSRTSSRVVQL
ncbi:MAG: hypothetical protein HY565_05525 [Candidatus Kerfeldbacteria bacterium]|nr:hypothetical protein [Candidatus Kerfeldbacteria bacterium]